MLTIKEWGGKDDPEKDNSNNYWINGREAKRSKQAQNF